jgi:hypothetical protein
MESIKEYSEKRNENSLQVKEKEAIRSTWKNSEKTNYPLQTEVLFFIYIQVKHTTEAFIIRKISAHVPYR